MTKPDQPESAKTLLYLMSRIFTHKVPRSFARRLHQTAKRAARSTGLQPTNRAT